MGWVYNLGRGLVVAGLAALFEAALVFTGVIPGDANTLGEYSYTTLVLGVATIALSSRLDFGDSRKTEDSDRVPEDVEAAGDA